MVERSKITLATKRSSEDLALFSKAIEKTAGLSMPTPALRPRAFVSGQTRLPANARAMIADPNPSVMIGNWFWNIG